MSIVTVTKDASTGCFVNEQEYRDLAQLACDNRDAIAAAVADIAANTAAINTNATNIATNTADIAALTTSVNSLQAAINALDARVTALEAQTVTPTIETVRVSHSYAISAAGAVTTIGDPGPVPVVTWTPGSGANGGGNDYQVTFPAGLVNPSAQVDVSGDIETGAGGDIDNAYIVQNVRFVGNVLIFTLYSGDDGGSEDDAARRDVTIDVSYDKDVVTNVVFA